MPPPTEDDEGTEPYRDRPSIESVLAVLRRRDVDGRAVDADRDGEEEDGLGSVPEVGAVDDGLGPRKEAPRRLVWPAGTARLISCSGMARPGLLAWSGSGCGLEGGGSWRGPALAGLSGPLSLLLRGGRPSVWLSSLTSIIKLRLAMTGGTSLLEMEVDAKLGLHSPVGLLKRVERGCSSRRGRGEQTPEGQSLGRVRRGTYTHYTQYTQYTRGYSCRCRARAGEGGEGEQYEEKK